MESKGLSIDDLADALGFSDPQTRRLVTGDILVTADIAERLAAVLGSTSQFWQRREATYRDSLALLKADDLARRAPLAEMAKRGWIRSSSGDWLARAESLMDYFGVADAGEWTAVWTARLSEARYRTSETFESDELSVAAWLRRAELLASQVPVRRYSVAALRGLLPKLRLLTRSGDPQRFVPDARELLAAAGVALVVLKATKDNRLSGAAFKLGDGTRAIVLSGRHLSEDHFWFTLFHELGHLVLHDGEGEFLDALDPGADETALEQEANAFAREQLVPGGTDALTGARSAGPTMREIARFAAAHRVAPGIVVGLLQHDGVLSYAQKKGLVRRFGWDGDELTQRT